MSDVIINKCETIRRCLKRISDIYQQCQGDIDADFTSQDALILNIQRACEASIDLANYYCKSHDLGVPQRSRDGFSMMEAHGVLVPVLSHALQKMVGLRNIAIHDYQQLNLEIVKSVVEHHLDTFEQFVALFKAKP